MRDITKITVATLVATLLSCAPAFAQRDGDHGDGGGGHGDGGGGRMGGGDHGGPGAGFHGGGDHHGGAQDGIRGGSPPTGRDGGFHGGPGGGFRAGGGDFHDGRGGGGPVYHGYGGYGYGGYGGYAGPFAVGGILGYYEGRPYYCYHRHHWRWSPRFGRYIAAHDRSC